MKKIVFVLNPHSGKALIKNALLKIIQVFSEAGYDVTVYPTKAPLDGYEYLKKREGQYDVLVCSGGDGTLNEVVRAVLEYQGDKPPIGYIPSGSTNDFATSLNIPKDMVRAAQHIAAGEPVQCDIGRANGERSFNYVAAFGDDYFYHENARQLFRYRSRGDDPAPLLLHRQPSAFDNWS